MQYNKKNFFLYLFLGFLISLPIVVEPISNPDLGWHLSHGRWMVENLSILKYDFLSWTKPGTYFVNAEWIYEIICYLIYKFSGYNGLFILKIIQLFGISFAISVLIKEIGVPIFNIFWIVPFFLISIIHLSDLRPDHLSLILFTLLLSYLYRIKDNSLISKKDLITTTLLFILWPNLHGGFAYGLFLIIIFIFGTIINENLSFIYGETKEITILKTKKFLIIFFIALLSTFINPYGYKIYSIFFDHFINLNKYQNYIMEWKEIEADKINISFLLISHSLIIVRYLLKFIKEKKVDMVLVFMMVFFILNGLLHIRLSMYASVIVFIVMGITFKDILKKYIYKIIFSLIFTFFSWFISIPYFLSNLIYLENGIFNKKSITEGTIKFLKENYKYIKNLNLYNGWSIGGWVGWELYDYKKIFMDGRYIFSDMLEEHIKAHENKKSWEDFSNKYLIDIGVFLIPKGRLKTSPYSITIKNKEYRFERPYYLENFDPKKWALVYFDKEFMIMVRRNSVSNEFLKRNEYIFLKPYDFQRIFIDTLIDKRITKYIKDEIIRYQKDYGSYESSMSDIFIYLFKDMISIEKGKFNYKEVL